MDTVSIKFLSPQFIRGTECTVAHFSDMKGRHCTARTFGKWMKWIFPYKDFPLWKIRRDPSAIPHTWPNMFFPPNNGPDLPAKT